MKKEFILFAVILFIALFNSCKHVPPDGILVIPTVDGGGTISGGTQVCSMDTIYFQNKVLPLLISSCAKSNCHDAISHQEGIELTSYLKVITTGGVDPGNPSGSKLYKVLNETEPDKLMPRPPSNPLTVAEKLVIYSWILQGAKNNACYECDTTSITWSAAVLPLININCKGCHNPAFLSAGLDLTNYASVKAISINGKLMGSINHLPGFVPMPQGGIKLGDCKITQLKKWIAAGALNN